MGLTQLVHGITGLAAGGYPSGGDGAGDGAHAVGDEDRREGEGGAEVPAIAGAEHRLAEREARPAEHDPERGECERDEQRERDGGVGLGEAGPQHDEDEDQPHVVGLPHRADGVVDQFAGTLAAAGAAGDEVPEPGAEVGAAEHGVGGDGAEQDDGDGRAHRRRHLLRRRRRREDRAAGAVGHVLLGDASVAEPAAHVPQDQDRGDAEAEVEHGHEHERDPDARCWRWRRPRPS